VVDFGRRRLGVFEDQDGVASCDWDRVSGVEFDGAEMNRRREKAAAAGHDTVNGSSQEVHRHR